MLQVKKLKEILESMKDEDEVVVELDDDEYVDIDEYVTCKRELIIGNSSTPRKGRLILTTGT